MTAGSIIVRQRGMTFLAGPGTGLGGDYTVFAMVDGTVKFEHATKSKKRIRVMPADAAEADRRAVASARPTSRRPPAGRCPHGRRWRSNEQP